MIGLDDRMTEQAASTEGHVKAAVDLARTLGAVTPRPGSGGTHQRWTALASLAAGDLSVARIAEAHLDALAILGEAADAGADPSAGGDDQAWGVYAAEGPGVRVTATETADGWVLDGTKPWCSAAHHLDRALVTAHVGDAGRRLFAVDLRGQGVTTSDDGWVARGLAEVASGPVHFDHAAAAPVGETGWYLTRPGFAWGGMGVAACWFGGLVGLARAVWTALERQSREPDQVALMHLGEVDLLVQRCRLALAEAAQLVDDRQADGPAGVVLAERVRGTVAGAAEAMVMAAGHALGPAPLAMDEPHARRVADLMIYVRQHHAERDSARLGRLLLDAAVRPW